MKVNISHLDNEKRIELARILYCQAAIESSKGPAMFNLGFLSNAIGSHVSQREFKAAITEYYCCGMFATPVNLNFTEVDVGRFGPRILNVDLSRDEADFTRYLNQQHMDESDFMPEINDFINGKKTSNEILQKDLDEVKKFR